MPQFLESPHVRNFEFTPAEAEALARHNIKVERIRAADAED